MSSNKEHMTMGEATRLVQGYPTQIWVPEVPLEKRTGMFAVVHDRRDVDDDERAIYFIPGNARKKMHENKMRRDVHEAGMHRRLMIPAAFLWDFHGGPCEAGGAQYRKIGASLIERAYLETVRGGYGHLVGEQIGTNNNYVGPLDAQLSSLIPEGKIALTPMNPNLLRSKK